MSRGEDDELRASTTPDVDGAADALAALELRASASDCAGLKPAFPDFTDATTPPELARMWSEPESCDVPVRGETYMDDQTKVAADASVARLVHFDAWTTATPEARHHITRFDLERPGDRSVVRYCAENYPNALVFVLNIELPDANNVSLVSYWLVPEYFHPDNNETTPFYSLLRRFVDDETDDSVFRNDRFKLIPSFTQAPWVLNQLVQSRPALTGKKLTQRYFKGPNYVEVAMDISSSTIAHYIGSLCQSWASYIEVDVFVTVQGETHEELPEQILGGVRLQYVDLALAQRVGEGDSESQEESDEA